MRISPLSVEYLDWSIDCPRLRSAFIEELQLTVLNFFVSLITFRCGILWKNRWHFNLYETLNAIGAVKKFLCCINAQRVAYILMHQICSSWTGLLGGYRQRPSVCQSILPTCLSPCCPEKLRRCLRGLQTCLGAGT